MIGDDLHNDLVGNDDLPMIVAIIGYMKTPSKMSSKYHQNAGSEMDSLYFNIF